MIKYSVVVPVYNEELCIEETHRHLTEVMSSAEESYEIIYVNDGSRDRSMEIISEIYKKDNRTKLINFSRNFGHQIAITAGMQYSVGQAVVVIDADLQDPPEVILEMIKKWKEGYDVVYGKRISRKGETVFKKVTAKLFYRFLNSMTSIDIPVDTGDFRLIDRRVCDTMNSLSEKSRYVRGLVSWVGYKQIGVEYIREERFAGETKYPLKKMFKLASDAIFSFSYKPLKVAGVIGWVVSGLGFIYLLNIIWQKLFTNNTVAGWASTLAILLLFNGLSLILHSITGEYVGRIYEETKDRPLFIVRDTVGFYEIDEVNKGGERNPQT